MAKAPLKTMLSWSSGKDSAWALGALRADPGVELRGLLTTVTAPFARVSMHAVRVEILRAQARVAGLPLLETAIPFPCPDAEYTRIMHNALERAAQSGVEAMAFGDLFLEDVRRFREDMLEGTGIQPLFPLWGRDTAMLARDMIAGGLDAVVTCVNPRVLPRETAGRRFDHSLLDSLPPGVDPCAENGEFHTLCLDAPGFREPIRVVAGEVVERDGFVFADFLPEHER